MSFEDDDDSRCEGFEAAILAADVTFSRASKRARKEQSYNRQQTREVYKESQLHSFGRVNYDPESTLRASIEGVVAVTGALPPPLSTTSNPRSVLAWVVKAVTAYGKREREVSDYNSNYNRQGGLHPDLVQPALEALSTINSLLQK